MERERERERESCNLFLQYIVIHTNYSIIYYKQLMNSTIKPQVLLSTTTTSTNITTISVATLGSRPRGQVDNTKRDKNKTLLYKFNFETTMTELACYPSTVVVLVTQ